MGNWGYYELIATFYSTFIGLIKQGATNDQAINRTFEDFWFLPEEDNVLVNTIVLVKCINVKIAFNQPVTQQVTDVFNLQLEKLHSIDLAAHLSPEEIEHLEESIEDIKWEMKD